MGKWKWMAMVLAIGMAIPAAMAFDDPDWLLKLELQAGGRLGERLDASIKETLVYAEDMQEYAGQETLFQLGWKAADWLKLALGYSEINARKNTARFEETEVDGVTQVEQANDHYWTRESRPLLDAILKVAPKGWKIADRNRFEWRDKEGQGPYLRYRNRLQVTPPWRWMAWKMAPYASCELFYEGNENLDSSDRFNDVRWTAGFKMKPMKQLQISPAMIYDRYKKSGGWKNLYTLQLAASLNF